MTDFLPRTIQADAQGVGFVSARGYGVEIIDGGAYGRENTLQLVRGEDGLAEGLAGADEVPCVAGTRMLGEFTGLRLLTPRVAPVLDRVKVRVLTQPGVRAVDSQPAGKPRVRFLSRGSAMVAPSTYQLLWASATDGEFDRFSLEEQFDLALYWFGWVGGTRNFTTYIFASNATNPAGNWHCIVAANAVNNKVTAPPPHPGGFVFDFSGPQGTLASTSAPTWRYPPGSVEVWVLNLDSLITNSMDWIFGVTG